MFRFALICALLCFCNVDAEEEVFFEKLASNIEKDGLLPNFEEAWRTHIHLWHRHHERDLNETNNGTSPFSIVFNCNKTAKDEQTAHSVHQLHPRHISIIGALGGSFVVGTAADATRLLETTIPYRGVAFPIGGDGNLSTTVTLPNVLKEYNPNLWGWSQSIAPAWFRALSHLNVAVPEARAKDLEDQAKEIIKRIKQIPRSDQEWKLITIFIGMTDLCDACDKMIGRSSAAKYRRQIKGALEKLRQELTRTVVNIVALPPISQWYRQLHDDATCWALHRYICPCISDPKTDAIAFEYNAELHDLASSYRGYDFTVLVQPFLSGWVQFPKVDVNGTQKTDQSLFAPDCFHFSRKGHAIAASALWTNLFQPISQKSTTLDFSQTELSCPDPNCPYIRTWQNSENCNYTIARLTTLIPAIENMTSDLWWNLTHNSTATPYYDHNFTTQHPHHWNFTGSYSGLFTLKPWTWNGTGTFSGVFFNYTIKPWHRAMIGLVQVPEGRSWGSGSSGVGAGWVVFGVLLAMTVVAAAIIGYVDLKKRQQRERIQNERTPLLQTDSNVEQMY